MKTQDSRLKTPTDSAATRHVVYDAMLSMLPIASYKQAARFAANLALCREVRNRTAYASRERDLGERAVFSRLLNLRVTPDIDQTHGMTERELNEYLNRRFGPERLALVPGFRIAGDTAYCLMPTAAGLKAYRDRHGYIAGVMCQPLERMDTYFLLSSSRYGGPKAVPMQPADLEFFEQYKLKAAALGIEHLPVTNDKCSMINDYAEYRRLLRDAADDRRAEYAAKRAAA